MSDQNKIPHEPFTVTPGPPLESPKPRGTNNIRSSASVGNRPIKKRKLLIIEPYGPMAPKRSLLRGLGKKKDRDRRKQTRLSIMNILNRGSSVAVAQLAVPHPARIESTPPDYATFARQEAELTRIVAVLERKTARATLSEVATTLKELLSAQLTADMVGVKAERSVQRWATGEQVDTGAAIERRLRTAYDVVELISYFDDRDVARAWFLGLKGQLGNITPVAAIRADRLQEVKALAKEFVTGASGG